MKRLALLALLALAPLCQAARIKGEPAYPLHTLIELKASDISSKDAQFLWRIDNRKASYRKAGDTLYITGPAGNYTVSLTAVDFVAKKVEEAEFTFSIGTGPTPPPGPDPDPTPTPAPPGKWGLSKTSREAKPAGREAEAAKLAAATRSHASAVAAGRFPGKAEALAGWRDANKAALTPEQLAGWKTWGSAVAAALKAVDDAGNLPGDKEWAEAYNAVADGLSPLPTKGR